ncbi:hypothetical protein [Embleya hyalina]|uniref:Uncharacterized protein n=1 Tax=Embleya hyalina TaxID=516124 RepID=A0A401Z713_9ACTN|nr:hypothetical protein [Embleya hyalina]GCE02608.1 hypothetical protein EHYA_10385 [Embleya hyalina]
MTVRRATATLLTAIFAVGLLAGPARAEPRPAPHLAVAAATGREGDGGQWLECHVHSFNDWCRLLGPDWHQKFWQYCDGIRGKQEYCVHSSSPAPADAALAPRG